MGPLARALDILQSDLGMYMGYLLPVLSSTTKNGTYQQRWTYILSFIGRSNTDRFKQKVS